MNGEAFSAAATVSFERARPGHFLGEGGGRTGDLIIRPIGIPAAVLERVALQQTIWRSHPGAWQFVIDRPDSEKHKYCHGHVLVYSGPPGAGGAARLAARAALRAGAGLVTVAAPSEAIREHAAQLNAVMVRGLEGTEAWGEALQERRVSAAVIGPGSGPGSAGAVLAALESQEGRPDPVPLVLDADALTSFEAEPDALFRRLAEHPALLTPHAGEFSRLFPDLGSELRQGPRSSADIARDAAPALRRGCPAEREMHDCRVPRRRRVAERRDWTERRAVARNGRRGRRSRRDCSRNHRTGSGPQHRRRGPLPGSMPGRPAKSVQGSPRTICRTCSRPF